MKHQTSNNGKPTGKENDLDHNTEGERPYDGRRPRTPRPPLTEPPRLIWTVLTAEGDTARELQRAQAHVIKEVLQWVMSRQPRSRSICSEPDPIPPTPDG